MPLAGLRLLPREIAQLGASHWHDAELVKMVATTLGESAGFIGAWHDNESPTGQVVSRDCGLMQVNIPAREIGSPAEDQLRDQTTRREVAIRVARQNVEAGYKLYEQPWDERPIRLWQPWVAYTTGIATFPEFWVWHEAAGKPVGPWVETGRYVMEAICGVSNFRWQVKRDRTLEQAIQLADAHARVFGIQARTVVETGEIAFLVPPKPSAPPPDGIGPRPTPNDGR